MAPNSLECVNARSLPSLRAVGCVPAIGGCTAKFAPNFQPNATIDDGSCVLVPPLCAPSTPLPAPPPHLSPPATPPRTANAADSLSVLQPAWSKPFLLASIGALSVMLFCLLSLLLILLRLRLRRHRSRPSPRLAAPDDDGPPTPQSARTAKLSAHAAQRGPYAAQSLEPEASNARFEVLGAHGGRAAPGPSTSTDNAAPPPDFVLPLLEWLTIPVGKSNREVK